VTLDIPEMTVDSIESSRQPSNRQPPLARLRILVVDDNYDVLQATSMLLSYGGAEVVCAMSASAAAAIALNSPPDAIVTDILMPVDDGFDLLRMLRVGGYTGPVIALTALGARQFKEREHAAGFAFCLDKPIEPNTLIATVRRAVLEG
jgi:CheY-like chemotaxis protein